MATALVSNLRQMHCSEGQVEEPFQAARDPNFPGQDLPVALPKAEQGRPPHPLTRMLRIYFMQQWFNQSDPAIQDALSVSD